MTRFQQVRKDSLVYGVGGVLAKSIGFLLLPVYTRIFSPDDYGVIEMLTVIGGFLAMLLQMGMDSAQSFYYFEQKNNGHFAQRSVVSAILQWRLIWGITLVFFAALGSPFLNYFFFNGGLSWEYFAVAFCGVLFTQLMSQSAEVFRLLYKPWRFIGITLVNTLMSAGLALLLILHFGLGVKGFLWGSLGGSFCSACVGWFGVRSYIDFSKIHREWWPRLLKFGVPLVPAGLSMYVLNTSDRWFVSHYAGQDALGVYAVGAKFALVITLAVTTFRQAWWPVAMDAMHCDDGPLLFRKMGRLYLGFGSAGVVVLTALSPYLVRWLTPPEYYHAYPLIGVLAWYSIFYGFYLIGAAGLWKAEKTKIAPLLAGSAAVLNIILDAILVPKMGAMGAALATSFSFFVWNILAIWVSERLWRVGYEYGVICAQVFLGVVSTAIVLLATDQGAPQLWVVFYVLIVVFILLAMSLDRRMLASLIRWGRGLA
ncbi:MAG: oligosaccharide flippase family protein [Desulfobulbaceae bacterium]|nr:oligosaccharide flippase family protein [Desulfobulbaceae bacterium]